jgi:Putative restriction endonuclease
VGRLSRGARRIRWVPAGRDDRRQCQPQSDQPQHLRSLEVASAGQPVLVFRTGCRCQHDQQRHSLPGCAGNLYRVPGTERVAPGVVVVFEVLRSDSGRRDRIEKVREYAAVVSIRRYVIVESTGVGLTVLQRESADEAWRVTTLTDDNTLDMPEIGIEIPAAAFYEDVDFTAEAASGG